MKLEFYGHDYKYAVEQSLLAFFPEERPVYEGDGEEMQAEVRLTREDTVWNAETALCQGERTARGTSRVTLPADTDPYDAEREKQKIVKLSFTIFCFSRSAS